MIKNWAYSLLMAGELMILARVERAGFDTDFRAFTTAKARISIKTMIGHNYLICSHPTFLGFELFFFLLFSYPSQRFHSTLLQGFLRGTWMRGKCSCADEGEGGKRRSKRSCEDEGDGGKGRRYEWGKEAGW
jgi:hypothetical protein